MIADLRARLRGRRRRRERARWQAQLFGPKLLRVFADRYPEAFFVEVGSNDGNKHDHLRELIHEGGWRGIMVEPVPFVFERLRANYGGFEQIALEQFAIADRAGELPFFHLAEADPGELGALPDFYDAIGSFSRDVIAGHADAIPDIEERIVETTVPCLTFDELCARNGDPDIDLLLIDVEGYDWELLSRVDLERHHPRLVVFEHYHLSAEDQEAAAGHLAAHGYEIRRELLDTWALDTSPEDAVTDAWRSLPEGLAPVSAHEAPEGGQPGTD